MKRPAELQPSLFLQAKDALFSEYYAFLNPRQQEAVATVKGPLLVLAGAGSGKTTVLVNRIGSIILFGDAWQSREVPDGWEELLPTVQQASGTSRANMRRVLEQLAVRPAAPYRVLCITFTNKAANEFKERLSALLGDRARDIWAGTFHSVCVRILRRQIDRLGYSKDFTIYDTDDVKKVITSIFKRLRIDEKQLSVKAAINMISSFKEQGLLPDDLDEDAQKDQRIRKVTEVYRVYRRELLQANAVDFDDIILLTDLLFEQFPEVLEQYRRQFDYILVDEFQDTNPSQSRLINKLGSGKGNVCVVGDDDQSIYSFRGATVENILQFDRVFPGARVVRLEQNYRSTGHILEAANAVIRHNQGRKGKNLWTQAGDGETVRVENPTTQTEEAALICDTVRRAVASGERSYGDFTVLYRMGALSNNIEQALIKSRIPYRICGGLRFNERREIKDVVAYLSVVNNPSDNVRLRRILNVPKRSIGDTTVAKMESLAESERKSLFEIASDAHLYPELERASVKLRSFAALIASMRDFAAENGLEDTVRYILEESGYLRYLQEEAEADGDTTHEREQNVREFLSTVRQYELTADPPTLSSFLEEMALVSDVDTLEEGQDAVTLMTIHSAKGLEFPVVFLVGFEDGVFPSTQAIMEGGVEEERRLAYVAITRAKQQLVISHCESRILYGRTEARVPSRFLSEIPAEHRTDAPRKRESGFGSFFGGGREFYNAQRQETARSFAANSFVSHTAPRERAGGQTLFAAGDRVTHAFFGAGTVLSAQEMGGDMLYEIRFDSGSVKRIMGSFAKLKRASE